MTLVSRNRIIRIMGIFTTVLFACIAALYAYSFFAGNFPLLEQNKRFFGNFNNFFIFNFNPYAVYIAVAALLLYVPVCCFGMLNYFEKTQIPELIYVPLFLVSFIPESFRLLLPLFAGWQNHPNLMIFISKVILFARISASVAMLTVAAVSTDRNDSHTSNIQFSILALCSVTVSFIPINSIQMLSTGFAAYSHYGFCLGIRLFFYAVTTVSFWLTGYKIQSAEYKRCALNHFLLVLGELILQECDNCPFLVLGIALLFGGTFCFYKNLHKYYMWK
ncbi:MAG: hypothetical protein MJ196_11410 [Treponemataceae bacterium]|nr:hypothetical protein [Treponemataceae bacterium]